MAALDNINYGFGQDTMEDVFDKTNLAIDRINDYYGEIKTSKITIGPWDMSGPGNLTLDTGLSFSTYGNNIIGFDFLIYNDSGVAQPNYSNTGEYGIVIDTYLDNSGQLRLILKSVEYSRSSFNDAVMNRGYIYLRNDMTI